MNFLLTGSKGFIGSNLLNKLKELYPDSWIFTFDEEDFYKPAWVDFLRDYIKRSNVIFHVGAISSTDTNNINDVMFKNYEFSKLLFDFAAHYGKKVIYSSSAAIYGKGQNVPLNLYAWSKKTAEDYGIIKCKDCGFVSLRYFNVFGIGEGNKGHMASVAYQAYVDSLKSERPFKLFPGKPKRDFVYIKDVVDANIFATKNQVPIGRYDVGSGEARGFHEVLEIMGIPYSENKTNIPNWYQSYTCADKKLFLPCWSPKYTIEKALPEYLSYLKKTQ